jgi:septal ring factor EnvC (AmiA/AmiB activator)
MTDAITLARENERLLALNADLKRQLDDWRDAHGVMHKAHAELEARIAELEAELMTLSQDDGKVERALIRIEEENARLRAALEAARDLSEIVRMPNAEHVADAHNDAVRKLREALR